MFRFALWCVRRRRAVIALWVALLLGLGVAAVGVGGAFTDKATLPHSESQSAYALIGTSGSTESGKIVWRASGRSITDPAVRAAVARMLSKVAAEPGVISVVSPYSTVGASQLNASRNTAFASVTVNSKKADVDRVRAAAETLEPTVSQVEIGGQAFTAQPSPSQGTEIVGVLAALVILLLVLRSAWAAALPVVTGVVGVAASMLAIVLGSHALDLSSTTLTMGALIGLGVGIDYALFIVNRHRRALREGATVPEGIALAMDTSGRAVIFAGATVAVALVAMFVVGLGILTAMAMAAALTVVLTVLAALTLLPALLAVAGRRVLARRDRPTTPAGRVLDAHAGAVARRPWIAAVAGIGVLALLAAPALQLRVGDSDASSDPSGSDSHRYFSLMAPAFGRGVDATLLIVARTPDADSQRAFTTLVARLGDTRDVAASTPVATGRAVSVATVTPATSAQSARTSALVRAIRDKVVPQVAHGTRMTVYVGGATATAIDLSSHLSSRLPYYLALIAVLGFALLALAFRSVLVPLVGALSNLATILVGLGAVVALFQWGWITRLLGVGSGAPISYIVPVILVGVVFGLSMDYQVFLVSGIHEEWHRTHDHPAAIRAGLRDTAPVILTAAAVMLCVFSSFGVTSQRIVATMGFGLAVAILVDALVVRLTVMPALLRLIGPATWWYPAWADRITPRVAFEGPNPAREDGEPELVAIS